MRAASVVQTESNAVRKRAITSAGSVCSADRINALSRQGCGQRL